jgi:tetratricopeptide (TPR) repeat protein
MWISAFALFVTPIMSGQGEDQVHIRLKAMALEQQGQNAEAEQLWDTIAKSDPQNAESLAHLGLLEARQDHYDTAIDFYRRAAAINSDLPGLQMNLGLALFKAAQFPDAIKSLASELRKHPGDPRLTILLGMAHYGMKDYLVAIPYLHRAAELDPQNSTLRTTLARSCLWSRQYQCVLDVQKELIAIHEESAEADMLAGEALDQLHESVGAEKEFRAAVLKNPTEINVHFGLGYLLWRQSKWLEAADEFQLELQNDSRHVKARIYLADAWVQQHEFAKALPELERLASDESEQLVHRDLGIIYANSGRSVDAIRELTMAAFTDPDDKEPHFQMAQLYRSVGRREEANAELDRARKLSSPSHSSLQEMIDSIDNPLP